MNSKLTLWLDVGTISQWRGKPTGIPRVIFSLALGLLKRGDEIKFCQFDEHSQTFFAVDRTFVEKNLTGCAESVVEVFVNKKKSLKKKLRSSLGLVWSKVVDPVLKDYGQELRVELVSLLRSAFHFVKSVRRIFRAWFGGMKKRKSTGPISCICFNEQDILISAGAGWAHHKYSEALWRIKRDHKIKVVSLIYDVIPCLLPQYFGPGFPGIYEGYVLNQLWSSDLILTISENSKRDIIGYGKAVDAPVPRIAVVRLGEEFCTGPARRPSVISDGERYVLCVGTFESRKNHVLLYQVWDSLIKLHGGQTPKLVIVGRAGWGVENLRHQMGSNPNTSKTIVLLENIDDSELSWLYKNCLFTVYPSFYEGWGLPIAESLSYGKLCVASNASSMPEVGGDLIDYEDPTDSKSWLLRIESRIFDSEKRRALEERIREQYRSVGWDEFSQQCLDLLNRHVSNDRLINTQRKLS